MDIPVSPEFLLGFPSVPPVIFQQPSFIEKKGPISQWTCFFWGVWVGGWFFEFIFPERNQCGEVHLAKNWGVPIWHLKNLKSLPELRRWKDDLHQEDLQLPPKKTRYFRKAPLTSQDQWSLWLSFMSFMFHDVLEMTRATCQKKQETLQTP